jgi:hypothetical protein
MELLLDSVISYEISMEEQPVLGWRVADGK